LINKEAGQGEKMAASGSLLVVIGIVALCVAVLGFLAALL
jgi:hypothetical protein